MFTRREMIGTLGGTALSLPFAAACSAQTVPVFRPEDFGARGDGATNDSAAFAAMSAAVNRAGGGTVELRRTTYLVAAQTRRASGPLSFAPEPLMEFTGCTRPLVVRGNGARLRAAPGLRYGTFDRRTGRPTRHPLPFYGQGETATPYAWMIKAERCSGSVEISDIELDGNLARLDLGGPWGDMGYQIHAYGIGLYNNSGAEILRNVHLHHHAMDGIIVDGLDRDRRVRSRFENVRSEYNGRQGCSIVGGRGYDFANCRFAHTGKAGVSSAPGAGVDIEAEDKRVRDLSFTDCEFVDNSGPGLLADSGDSEGAAFTRCTFVGTTTWSAWPKKPNLRFDQCNFVGAMANAYADAQRPDRSARFTGCTFRDDPALSPTRAVYGTIIAELPSNPGVTFSGCTFRLTHQAVLPWSTGLVTYESCTMSQRSPTMSYPRGRYLGRSTITGNVGLSGSNVVGELIVNGRPMRGRIG
jgi:hypothetical protein